MFHRLQRCGGGELRETIHFAGIARAEHGGGIEPFHLRGKFCFVGARIENRYRSGT